MSKNKILFFEIRGEWYKVNTKGEMTQTKNNDFSDNWIFSGVSFHHWRQSIDLKFKDMKDVKDIIGGRVWDVDHGTTRLWGGLYNGKIPRITNAYYLDHKN